MKRLLGVTLIALTLGFTACTSANTADKEEVFWVS